MSGQKAIHFGAGNIGRGFLGELLGESGYEIVFLDVIDELVDKLQKYKTYNVTELSDDGEHVIKIENYRAINTKRNEADAIEEIKTADLVTCAVGEKPLQFIAPLIAKGIDGRTKEKPLAVIACENLKMATNQLKAHIDKHLQTSQSELSKKARFANSAVDRIVPPQTSGPTPDVRSEKFYEWCVESGPFKDIGHPQIKAAHFVEDLLPYFERKLFTVNAGHATAAYYGYVAGYQYVYEALHDKKIRQHVEGVLRETSHHLVSTYGMPAKEQQQYAESVVNRFSSHYIKDEIARVGRDPKRKLSSGDRLVRPASELARNGESIDELLGAIEMALWFQYVDYVSATPPDPSSGLLGDLMAEADAKSITQKLTGLEPDHVVFDTLEKIVAKVQGNPDAKKKAQETKAKEDEVKRKRDEEGKKE